MNDSHKKVFTIGAAIGMLVIFAIAASGPIQHVIVDNASVTIAGNVGLTNANQPDVNLTNTPSVKGWPLYSVAAQFAVATGVVTNGAGLAAAQQVVADADTETPFLISATYVLNTNCASYNPQVYVYVFKSQPTALGANGALRFTYADWTNCVGTLTFTNRWLSAGTNAVQTVPANFAVMGTNWIVPVAETLLYTNLAGSDTIVFSFQQGR